MVRLGLLYICFSFVLLRSSSDANKVIVGRAEARYVIAGADDILLDFFIYTDDSSCGNADNVNPWCNQRNGDPLTTLPIYKDYKCSCQCKHNVITFLLDERRCVNESYLMSRFGSGIFLLYPAIDLTIDSHLDTNMGCMNCQVTKIEYHQANNVWKKVESRNIWDINNNGRLDWKKSTVDEVNGKIIRIQICQNRSGQGCVYHQTLFCKSKGNSSLTITDVSPTPTASAVFSSIVISTPTSTASLVSSAVPTSPIHTSKMSTPWSQVLVPATYTSQPPGTNKDRRNINSNEPQAGSQIGAIVGVVIACIVVIVMIVIIFIIWKRRKQTSRSNSSKTVAINSTGDPRQNQGEIISLPQRQDNDDNNTGNEEYDYAVVDGGPSHQKTSKPLYESLNKDNVQDSVYAHLSKEQSKETPVDFNHLQHPQYNPAFSKSGPLYNNLEIQNKDHHLEHETQNNHNPKAAEGSHPDTTYQPLGIRVQGQESVYAPLTVHNTLQHPQYNPAHSKRDPLDNTFKRANDDEHLDHETQNNHNPKAAKGPEGAHPDQTYQPLGVRVQDDLYQPLDRASQSNDKSLYQNAI